FHGYYFRIVAQNSPAGVSGRRKCKTGLTCIAYPVEYQSSGVKTFVLTHKGVVFEKDLEPKTTILAPQMNARTGTSWHPATWSLDTRSRPRNQPSVLNVLLNF